MSNKKKDKSSEAVSKEVANLIKIICFDYEKWLRERIKELNRLANGENIR